MFGGPGDGTTRCPSSLLRQSLKSMDVGRSGAICGHHTLSSILQAHLGILYLTNDTLLSGLLSVNPHVSENVHEVKYGRLVFILI